MAAAWPELAHACPRTAEARSRPRVAAAAGPAWSELARAHGPAWLELGLTDLQLQRQETEWLRVVCAAQTLQRFLLSIIQLKY
jgi:hypothetical protein